MFVLALNSWSVLAKPVEIVSVKPVAVKFFVNESLANVLPLLLFINATV